MTDVELTEFPAIVVMVVFEVLLEVREGRGKVEADEEQEEEVEGPDPDVEGKRRGADDEEHEDADCRLCCNRLELLLLLFPEGVDNEEPVAPFTGKGQVKADLRIDMEVRRGTRVDDGGGRRLLFTGIPELDPELSFNVTDRELLPPFIIFALPLIFPLVLEQVPFVLAPLPLLLLLLLLLLFFLCFLYLTLYKL